MREFLFVFSELSEPSVLSIESLPTSPYQLSYNLPPTSPLLTTTGSLLVLKGLLVPY